MEKCGDDAQKRASSPAWARRLEEPSSTLFFNNCVKTFIG